MVPRYTRPEMAAIWSPEARFRIWFEIEALAAEAMADLGTIPAESAQAIRREGGARIAAMTEADLARIDEASYRPGAKLAMGAHPVIWFNPRSNGRVVYSALGHTPQAYNDPNYRRILANAIRWAAR